MHAKNLRDLEPAFCKQAMPIVKRIPLVMKLALAEKHITSPYVWTFLF